MTTTLQARCARPWIRATATPRRLSHQLSCRCAENGAAQAGGIGGDVIEIDLDDVVEIPNLRQHLKPLASPLCKHNNFNGGFIDERDRVALSSIYFATNESAGASDRCRPSANLTTQDGDDEECVVLPSWAVRAGARKCIYFEPKQVTAAIVTCGGLCPGLNDVVQGIVCKLEDYGVPEGNILGIRYGFKGFYSKEHRPIVLTRSNVEGIQLEGGTILGTSRGGADMREIVKRIDMWGLDMVFVIGGNGGNAGANAIQKMCEQEGIVCSVIGIPKSIDNDILLVDRCFGFDTAVEESQRALLAARVEAESAHDGVGLVKLMGRSSGFIAMQASLASGCVDVCLIPEVAFELEGEHGVLQYVRDMLQRKGRCVICVAEGAGQDLLESSDERDASGNPVLADIGRYMKAVLRRELPEADVKYIDPTYMIRAIPTCSQDRIYCKILAHNAVHAAMAAFTGVTVGLVNTHYAFLPIPLVIERPRTVDPKGKMWNRLRAAIGQPNFLPDSEPEVSDAVATAV